MRLGSGWTRRAVSVAIVLALLGTVALASIGSRAHTGAWIDSKLTASSPAIDGTMGAGEWADATQVNLGAIPGNPIPAWLLVKNNGSFLFLAYDAVGDTTRDAQDSASVGFDTDHDATSTIGREDEFFWGGAARSGEEHWVADPTSLRRQRPQRDLPSDLRTRDPSCPSGGRAGRGHRVPRGEPPGPRAPRRGRVPVRHLAGLPPGAASPRRVRGPAVGQDPPGERPRHQPAVPGP